MENLSKLLERFTKVLNKDKYTKETIAKVILELTRVSLNHEDVNLKGGVLEIITYSAAKSEINLKTQSILTELKAQKVLAGRIVFR